MRDLESKTAVVTGGASGIGRGLALTFAAAGMNVVVGDVEDAPAGAVVAEITAAGGCGLAVHTDVTDRASVEQLAGRAYDAFGAVHLLCNNAGVMAWRGLAESTHADVEWVLAVNLWGVLHGVEAFVPRMLARGDEAHIVNTASIAGVIPSAVSSLYSTTKYAVVGLSDTLRNELAPHRIGVSVLCPGGVQTRIGDSERNRPARWGGPQPRPEVRRAGVSGSSLDALTVGAMVLAGVRENAAYIFTDPAMRAHVEARHRAMMEAFDRLS